MQNLMTRMLRDPVLIQDYTLMGYEGGFDEAHAMRSLERFMLGGNVFTGFEDGGFNERADIAVAAADGTDLNEMWDEIRQILAIRNAQRSRLIDQLTFRVNGEIDLVGVPSEGTFEKASEYGQPRGIRGFKNFNRGYSFDFYDLAVRYTWMFIAEATGAQLRNLTNMALDADNRLIFSEVMKCFFNPLNLVGTADSNIPVNVYKFYNGDGEIPPRWKTTSFDGTHNHYLVSGTASLTPAALDTIEADLYSHGYGVQTGTKLVLLVNKQEAKLIKTFRVASGATYDFIPSGQYGGGVIIPLGTIVARPEGEVPGQVGTYGPFHIVQEDYCPPGYVSCLAAGGPDNLTNPIGFREHKNAAYQGLKIIPGQRSDYPLVDSFFRRGFGVGVRQRGAAIIMQVKASGTYSTPAEYV